LPEGTSVPGAPRLSLRTLAWCVALLAAVSFVFSPVRSFEFVHYDDLDYVLRESQVRLGLTWASVRWAFTEARLDNWHPLTTLSYLLDAELWGMSPGAFHGTSVALHACNTVGLFLLLQRLTRLPARSAIVAALFALHPLHVESVAWVAARKDVLSTLFLLATIYLYARWVERPGRWRYAALGIVYAFGLMSKPMLVTLPFVLLLLDHWPLGRFAETPAAPRPLLRRLGQLALEKAPLFVLAGMSSAITLVVQSGAMKGLAHLGALERIANAAQSYLRYLGMTVWPAKLGVLYPMPPHIDLAAGALAGAIVLGVSVAVLRSAGRLPYLFTGWFWYLGTLVPVIGLVQVGFQSHADRYTYVPLIGIFIAVVWAVAELTAKRRSTRLLAGAAAAVVVALLSVRTWFQLDYWRNSEALFERTLEVAPENPYIHYNLATVLGELGRYPEAAAHFREAVRVQPELTEGWTQLALVLAAQGDLAEASRVLGEIPPRAADSADVHHATGLLAFLRGDLLTAEREASEALRIEPTSAKARDLLQRVYAARKHRSGATRR
jgi:protein O-mannosyl-transferase